ncbi:MAG: amidohydrolase family protein [Candidatus Kariarchaeaceae archaeon]
MNKRKIIRAKYVIPVKEPLDIEQIIEDGYIMWKGKIIEEVAEYTTEVGEKVVKEGIEVVGQGKIKEGEEVKMLKGVALPGFVKAHGHDHESLIIGVANDKPLTEWLDGAVNLYMGFLQENEELLEEKLGESPYLVMYLKARLDDLQHGITSNMVHHCNFNKYHVKEIAEANKQAGTKMIVAVGSQDRHYDSRILDSPEEAVERLENYYEEFKDDENLRIIPGPDQFFSNGPELLKALKKWAREKETLFHLHSSEEGNTTAWFKETYGMTPIEYGKSIGVLDASTIVAHQVHNTEEDLKDLAETGTQVVHNPLANTILGSGMPPIIKMQKMGIPVVISTDGSGSADNQNIINAARSAAQYQKAFHKDASLLPAKELLPMITSKPAKMLRFNTGTLEKGKDADITVIDLTRTNLIPTRKDNLLDNLFWAASGNEVSYVIANGEVIIENYQQIKLNHEKICDQIMIISEMFNEYRINKEVRRQTGAIE